VMSPRLLQISRIITGLFTAAVCAGVAWYAGQFVLSEWDYGGRGAANLPTAMLASIIPFAFSLMSLRYLIYAALLLRQPAAAEQKP